MTPEDKKLNSYYWRKFGWTLSEVNAMFEKQGNVCYICKRPPGERRMAVDHDHAYDRVKITVYKDCGIYIIGARPYVMPLGYSDKKEGRHIVRNRLRRLSVRGGLCMRCNKGIQMFEDSKAPLTPAERFDRAAKYFRDFRDSRPDSEQHENRQPNPDVPAVNSDLGVGPAAKSDV